MGKINEALGISEERSEYLFNIYDKILTSVLEKHGSQIDAWNELLKEEDINRVETIWIAFKLGQVCAI